jgi:hypothetical protein
MHFKQFMEQLITDPEDLESFGSWAFGEELRTLEGSVNFMHKWNEIHGKELMLSSSGSVAEDVPEMISLWRVSRGLDE